MLRFNSAERQEDAGPTSLDYAAIIVAVVAGFVVLAFLLRGTYTDSLYGAAFSVSPTALKPGQPVVRPPVLPPSTIRSGWSRKFPIGITDEAQRNGYIRRYRFADGSVAVYRAAYLDGEGIVHKAVVEMTDAAVDVHMSVTVHPYGLTNQAASNPVFERSVRDGSNAVVATDVVQLSNAGISRGTSTRVLRYYLPPDAKPVSESQDVVPNPAYKSLLDDARYFLSIQDDAKR